MSLDAFGIEEDAPRPGVLRWTLDHRARRNAVGPEALGAITDRCAELRGEIVVLTGEGDEAFCSGFDLTALKPDTVAQGIAPDAALIAATAAMERADATFIAVVNGYAIGAGVELMCACDFRMVRRDATFRIPAARLGVVYHAAGLIRLRAALGPALTRRLMLLGERVGAPEAVRMGAALDVYEARALDDAVDSRLERLLEADPGSLRGNRDLLRALDRGPLDAATLADHEQARTEAYQALATRNPSRPDSEG